MRPRSDISHSPGAHAHSDSDAIPDTSAENAPADVSMVTPATATAVAPPTINTSMTNEQRLYGLVERLTDDETRVLVALFIHLGDTGNFPAVNTQALANGMNETYTSRASANTGWHSMRLKLEAIAQAGPISITTTTTTLGSRTVTVDTATDYNQAVSNIKASRNAKKQLKSSNKPKLGDGKLQPKLPANTTPAVTAQQIITKRATADKRNTKSSKKRKLPLDDDKKEEEATAAKGSAIQAPIAAAPPARRRATTAEASGALKEDFPGLLEELDAADMSEGKAQPQPRAKPSRKISKAADTAGPSAAPASWKPATRGVRFSARQQQLKEATSALTRKPSPQLPPPFHNLSRESTSPDMPPRKRIRYIAPPIERPFTYAPAFDVEESEVERRGRIIRTLHSELSYEGNPTFRDPETGEATHAIFASDEGELRFGVPETLVRDALDEEDESTRPYGNESVRVVDTEFITTQHHDVIEVPSVRWYPYTRGVTPEGKEHLEENAENAEE